MLKGRLYERIAELTGEKKLPLVGDVRDESAEEIRLVIEPKTRIVDPVVMMESLFKQTELEIRFGLKCRQSDSYVRKRITDDQVKLGYRRGTSAWC